MAGLDTRVYGFTSDAHLFNTKMGGGGTKTIMYGTEVRQNAYNCKENSLGRPTRTKPKKNVKGPEVHGIKKKLDL